MPKGVYPHHKRMARVWSLEDVDSRIAIVQDTIQRLEDLVPALGGSWREGMLRYYRRIISELERYRDAIVQTQSRPE